MSKRVLLIDDEEIVYLLINRHIELLNMPNVTLTWAETLEEGLEYAQKGDWDLILVDLLFGLDFRGPELIVGIKNIVREENTRIIAITQLSLTDAQKKKCIDAGVEEIITKWPSREEMQTLLRGWLNPDDSTSLQLSLLESIRLQLRLFTLQHKPLHV